MDTAASEQIFLRIFLFSPVIIIPPMFHARWFIYHRHYVTLKTDSVVKQLALKTKRGHLEVLSVGRKKGGGMGKQKAGEVCEVKAKTLYINCLLRLTAVLKQTPPGSSVAL